MLTVVQPEQYAKIPKHALVIVTWYGAGGIATDTVGYLESVCTREKLHADDNGRVTHKTIVPFRCAVEFKGVIHHFTNSFSVSKV